MREQRFPGIGEDLLRVGLAPRHVRRILLELENHMDDLLSELEGHGLSRAEAQAEATRRLRVEAVVGAARERTELHSKMRRWPLIAFTLLPLFVYAALFVGALALVVMGLTWAKQMGMPIEHSLILQQLTTASFKAVELLLPASVAITFCMLATSRRAPLSWTLAGVVLVSLLGATTNAQLSLPPLSVKPAVGAGLGFSTEAFGMPLLRAASTIVVVLLPYLWLTRAKRPVV